MEMSGDGTVLIVRIQSIFGTTIWPSANTLLLYCLLFALNRIQIEYLVQPYS